MSPNKGFKDYKVKVEVFVKPYTPDREKFDIDSFSSTRVSNLLEQLKKEYFTVTQQNLQHNFPDSFNGFILFIKEIVDGRIYYKYKANIKKDLTFDEIINIYNKKNQTIGIRYTK